MKTVVSFLLLLLLFACKEEHIQPLPAAKELTLQKSVSLPNFCLHSGIIKDSLLIFMAGCDPDERYIHIFNTHTLQPITSLGTKGRLYSEFNFPLFYQSNFRDSVIRIYDMNLSHSKQLRLHSNPDSIRITGSQLPTALYFCDELNNLNDSLTIGQNISDNKKAFFIYNNRNDSLQWIQPHFKMTLPTEKGRGHVYSKTICTNTDRIIVGYRHFDLFEIYDSQGRFLKDIRFSPIKTPLFKPDLTFLSPDANLYITNIIGTPSYCFLTRIALPLSSINEKIPEAQIIKIDWDGNVIDCYRYPNPDSFFVIDEAKQRLFISAPNPENLEMATLNEYKL